MTEWLLGLPAVWALVAVGVLLVAETGLLAGVVLPAATPVIGLGMLAGTGALPLPLVAGACATASLTGVVLAHRATTRRASAGMPPITGRALLPRRATVVLDRVGVRWSSAFVSRPRVAAAGAQLVAGARTMGPRVAAGAGVPLRTVLTGAVPAALAWAAGLVTAGATLTAVLPLLRGSMTVLGVPLVIAVSWWLLRQKPAPTPTLAPPQALQNA